MLFCHQLILDCELARNSEFSSEHSTAQHSTAQHSSAQCCSLQHGVLYCPGLAFEVATHEQVAALHCGVQHPKVLPNTEHSTETAMSQELRPSQVSAKHGALYNLADSSCALQPIDGEG